MTEQEEFWRGEFGDAYSQRNAGEKLIDANVAFFNNILFYLDGDIDSIIEFGANRGLNIVALQRVFDDFYPPKKSHYAAVEINHTALAELEKIKDLHVIPGSMLDFNTATRQYDLAFTKGVLIHIAPEDLGKAYDALFRSSRRYILMAEYFNPTPVEIEYRGHKGKLWKRDFCAEMLDRYVGLKLVDYGFVYARDPVAPLDNLHWFLLEKGAQ